VADENGNLIRRWDNAPHFPHLDKFPHHIHVSEREAAPGEPINIFGVLGEIEKTVKK